MRVRDEIRLAVIALLVVQIITSFAAIGLLSRMSPAIERILQENVYSISAVEDMFAVLAIDGSADAAEVEKFEEALSRAQSNVTEEAETPQLEIIEDASGRDLSEPSTRQNIVEALHELGRINRESMREADVFAKRLGTAGAWAAVFLGVLGFILSVLAVRRLSRRILSPLDELSATVHAHAGGDPHRRCYLEDAPEELRQVGETINAFIDDAVQRDAVSRRHVEDVTRAATLHYLDSLDGSVWLCDSDGEIIAANQSALEFGRTQAGQQTRAALPEYVTESSTAPDGLVIEHIRDDAVIVRVENTVV